MDEQISALFVGEIVMAKRLPINETLGIRSKAKSWQGPRVTRVGEVGRRETRGGAPDKLVVAHPKIHVLRASGGRSGFIPNCGPSED